MTLIALRPVLYLLWSLLCLCLNNGPSQAGVVPQRINIVITLSKTPDSVGILAFMSTPGIKRAV